MFGVKCGISLLDFSKSLSSSQVKNSKLDKKSVLSKLSPRTLSNTALASENRVGANQIKTGCQPTSNHMVGIAVKTTPDEAWQLSQGLLVGLGDLETRIWPEFDPAQSLSKLRSVRLSSFALFPSFSFPRFQLFALLAHTHTRAHAGTGERGWSGERRRLSLEFLAFVIVVVAVAVAVPVAQLYVPSVRQCVCVFSGSSNRIPFSVCGTRQFEEKQLDPLRSKS